MPEVSAHPIVTYVEDHWQGVWLDGYTVIVHSLDVSRPGICRAELEVLYQDAYLNTLTVDLLSSRAREEFSVAMGSRNGVAPIIWDGRLGNLYRALRQGQAQTTEQSPWAQVRTA